MRRNLIMGVITILLVVGVITSPRSSGTAGARERVQSANDRGRIVYDTGRGNVELVRRDGERVDLGRGRFGQIDAAGNVYFGDWNEGLHRYDARTGEVEEIRPARRVGVPFFLEAGGRYLVHQSYSDFPNGQNGEDLYETAGVVLLDLATGQDRVLYEVRGQYAHALTWVGSKVMIQTWEDGQAPYPVFRLVDLQGRSERMRALEAAPLPIGWPITSPDQQAIAYPSEGGYAMARPANQKFQFFADVERAYWSSDGLVLIKEGQESVVSPNSLR